MAGNTVHARDESRKSHHTPKDDPTDDLGTMFARGRLKEARQWFGRRGWNVLPQDERGRRVLAWGADHAWLAGPANPKRSVRNWCRRWWPSLSDAELAEIVARTETSNKRWSADQCAVVLEITVRDRESLGFRFVGAMDDPEYEHRNATAAAKHAARSRKYRAARGAKTRADYEGKSLSRTKPWEAEGISRASYYRRRRNGETSPCRDITFLTNNKSLRENIGSVTHLSHEPDLPSRPLNAARRAPEPVLVEFFDEHGNLISLEFDADDPELADFAPFAAAAGAAQSRTADRWR
jgi:hypothetical protein